MNARLIRALFCGLIVAGACTTVGDTSEQLVRVDWQLSTIAGPDGKVYEIDPSDERFVRFDGKGNFTTDGCNSTGGPVRINSERLFFGQSSSTLIGCRGEAATLDSLVNRLLSDEAIWKVATGELRLRGSGVVAKLKPPSSEWPKSDIEHVLIEERISGGPQLRMGWFENDAGVYVAVQGRTSPGLPWGEGGSIVPPDSEISDEIHPHTFALGDRFLAFGAVQTSVSRVEFRRFNGDPVDIRIYKLPQGRKAFAGLLEATTSGPIVALTADGTEVARSRPLPDPTPAPE